jgi:PST family polysaccharide transporter/lipopolysaccharide exporter
MRIFLRNIAKPLLFCLIMVGVVSIYKTVVGYSGLGNMLAEIAIGGTTYATLTLAYKLSLTEIKAYRQALL